ncbi:hypothetical protein PM3016_2630 [Paenibacillus mucilaginosus 3016]|uniref:Sugar isomerase n=1 Tax=Paenibacillus mucilaginosus 3016 TaxID=1116391 RepID=H6NFA3_9BACL|nr:DUF3231 family protein [Paenibacillus mucilaginosus]AFC29512.1 hypothetical protein PM3016_2630 [Paenibacillus mucilaginosus 3016]WFA18213.1 DUF3231 family protein [Paenibacillus mucilaginosus]
MAGSHVIGLTATELSALWSTYMGDSISLQMSRYFLAIIEDKEVKPLLELSMALSQTHLKTIRDIFEGEKFPVPVGLTEADVNLSAPPLFFDLFPLSYVYAMSRMALAKHAMNMANVARKDIRSFFSQSLHSTTELYNQSVELMLSKGIYDRPPLIPYPDHVSFIQRKENILSRWFAPQRTLNVMEMSEMFFNIERNFFGLIVLMAFIQVVKDEKIKHLLFRGKKLAQHQIEYINEKLIQDDLLGTIMVNTEVTTSTVSPFSDKLILTLTNYLNSTALTYLGSALSMSTRLDLAVEYTKLISDVMQYGKDLTDLLIEREWMEEPPHSPNRAELAGV